MAVVINTNVAALHSARLLSASSAQLSKSLARLSSGSRIVSPEDDSAGLAQSINFDAQIHRNSAADINVQNAISFSQTQDGFLQKVQKALDRMSEISVLAQDATKTDEDRSNYNSEFTQLFDFIFNDVATKKFNGVSLFSTSGLEVTIDSDATTFGLTPIDLDGDVSFILLGLSVDTSANAFTTMTTVKTAIENIAADRAKVGSNLARLTMTSESLQILNQNLSAANSLIRDVDVAKESTDFARNNILVQSGTAMLAQANVIPQTALRLLG
ncbi:MAG: flagellin [Verrucomicrobia bacterium]|nr:flagellin [Verrucomicrobiota bacterium]